MNKTAIGIISALIFVIVGTIVVSNNPKVDKNNEVQPINSAQNTSEESTQTDKIFIENFAFSPQTVKIKVGTTLTWTNQGTAKHDITPDTENDDFIGSNLLAKGESYSFTFKKPGTYTYHCSPHPFMKANILVE